MKTRIAAAAAALVLGVASLSPALAFDGGGRYTAYSPYEVEVVSRYDNVYPASPYLGCPMNSAAEGNANQQNFPTQQYGQTSGGNRC